MENPGVLKSNSISSTYSSSDSHAKVEKLKNCGYEKNEDVSSQSQCNGSVCTFNFDPKRSRRNEL